MKKLSLVFLLALAATSCKNFAEEIPDTNEYNSVKTRVAEFEERDYYWYNGEKVYLTIDNRYVNIIMDDLIVKSSISNSLFEKTNMELDDSKQFDGVIRLKLNPKGASMPEYSNTVASLKQGGQVKYVLPYYSRGDDAEPIGTSEIFYLKLKTPEDITLLEKMAAELGVQIKEEVPYTPCWYMLSILGSEFNNSVEASNYFYETGRFEDIDPAFMFDFKLNADDPDFQYQWGMKNISYSGIDINVIPAWGIARGTGVKVAVVDTPIDSNHGDLNDNIHSLSYNAKLKQTPSAPYSGVSSHGTHVAGIIAAEKNGVQVTGVAYESKIMRVSHDMYSSPTISSELASGINWAWQNGADVINCSWGDRDQYHNLHMEMHSALLEQSIVDAMNKGRENKGCVVVFAAGNSGELGAIINYPGSYHDNILVVGSIDQSGLRSSFAGYGTKLDIVAPGRSILSTIPGSTGYMNGTSMAAPHVAGIAALILSKYPNFTQKQVADIIESTARKVGGYSYTTQSGRTNGTWNNQTGYGLVDAHAALFGNLAISGPDSPRANNTATYRILNQPAGVTFNGWTVTSDVIGATWQTSNLNTTPFQITFNTAGKHIVTANFSLPNNDTYYVTKTINVAEPFVLHIPLIMGELYTMIVPYPYSSPPTELSADGAETDSTDNDSNDDGFTADATPGKPIDQIYNMLRFYVQNTQNNVTYEWKVNGGILGAHWGSNYVTNVPHGSQELRVYCRAYHGDEVSGWSNAVIATANGIETEFVLLPLPDPPTQVPGPIDTLLLSPDPIIEDPILPPTPIDSLKPINKGGPIEVIEP